MAAPIQEAALRYGIQNQGTVDRGLDRFNQKADRINQKLDKAQQKIQRGQLGQVGIIAGRAFVTGAIGFAATEFLAEAAENVAGVGAGQFVSTVGGATFTGLAFGGFAGGLAGFVTGSISFIFGLFRGVDAEQERLRKELEAFKKLQENTAALREQERQIEREQLADRFRELENTISRDALELAHKSYVMQ